VVVLVFRDCVGHICHFDRPYSGIPGGLVDPDYCRSDPDHIYRRRPHLFDHTISLTVVILSVVVYPMSKLAYLW
jgi:hypothetical protein